MPETSRELSIPADDGGGEDLAQRYTNATERTFWPVTLHESGAGKIGHIGFFRSEFRPTLQTDTSDRHCGPRR